MQTSDEQIPGTVTPDGGVDTRAAAGGGKLRELAEMPVGRLLWKYSLPAVVGMLVVQLYNVIDRIVIGQVVGAKAIAGLAITFPVMNIATALGVLVGAGASARISLFLGAGDAVRARRVLGNSLTLTLIIGTVYIGLFAMFLSPILRLFGADDATLPYARDFMIFILPGLLMTNLTFSFNNMMRASGYPMKAMATMFVGCGLNILLAPLFVWALGLGIKGAAVATDISMTVSMVFVMRHFCVHRHGPVVFTRGIYRLDPRLIWGIIGIGAAPSIVNVASCVINIFLNHALKDYGGYEALAAAGIFVTYTSMLCCIVIGICQGMQPVIGFNYGNGQPARVRRTFLAGGAGRNRGDRGGMGGRDGCARADFTGVRGRCRCHSRGREGAVDRHGVFLDGGNADHCHRVFPVDRQDWVVDIPQPHPSGDVLPAAHAAASALVRPRRHLVYFPHIRHAGHRGDRSADVARSAPSPLGVPHCLLPLDPIPKKMLST